MNVMTAVGYEIFTGSLSISGGKDYMAVGAETLAGLFAAVENLDIMAAMGVSDFAPPANRILIACGPSNILENATKVPGLRANGITHILTVGSNPKLIASGIKRIL